MRPSFQLDPGLIAPDPEGDGTLRHTLSGLGPQPTAPTQPIADGLADDFFAAGDDGCFAGADPEPIELEAPVPVVVRTPEMDARRARFARVVAAAVGCFAALFAFGVVMNGARAASAEPSRAARAVAPPARMVAPPAVGSPLQPALQSPGPSVPSPEADVAKPARVEPRVQARAARPARPAPVIPAPAPRAPVRTVPAPAARQSVANFAARAGDAPKSASAPPTAAFALTP